MSKFFFSLIAFVCFNSSLQASELFVRVNKLGSSFYAMVGLQTHYNNSTTFRFFDLPQGVNELKIYYNNTSDIFYSGSIFLEQNQRVVCEIDMYGNLSIIEKQFITNQNWYTSFPQGGNQNFSTSTSTATNSAYQEFLKNLKEESFDSGKLEKSKKYVSKTSLSASQINEIAVLFSFDSNRLDWAKYAYQYCYDKQNYFLLKSSFSFSSNYSDLEKFIEGK